MKVVSREYILYPSKYFGELASEGKFETRMEITIWTQKTYLETPPEFHVSYILKGSSYDASIYFHLRSVAIVDWEGRLPNEWELWEEVVLVAKESYIRFAQECLKVGRKSMPGEPDIYKLKDELMLVIRDEIDRLDKYGK